MAGFEPYIGDLGVDNIQYFFATPEAKQWYDPIKPYTKIEYEWVARRLVEMEIKSKKALKILDAGCHQGNYARLLADYGILIAVDPNPSNCDTLTIS